MASSISHRLWLLHLRPVSSQRPSKIRLGASRIGWSRWDLRIKASSAEVIGGDGGDAGRRGADWIGRIRVSVERTVGRLQEAIAVVPPVVFTIERPSKLAVSISAAFAILVIIVRKLIIRNTSHIQRGSVVDLVKRGQLRSDRRGISKPLKYEDPFNNPLVKVHKTDSTVEMCGKVYQMAAITLTEEQQSSHRKRRSRAYKWTRPTIFLKEGDEVPSDVDPDTVRWIPANHPFATTVSDIDEGTAQNNVYQTDGVPFRIRAEHEALQRKLEMLETVIFNLEKVHIIGEPLLPKSIYKKSMCRLLDSVFLNMTNDILLLDDLAADETLQEQKPNTISITTNSSRDIEQQSKLSQTKDETLESTPSVGGEFGQTVPKSRAEQSDSNTSPEGLKTDSEYSG